MVFSLNHFKLSPLHDYCHVIIPFVHPFPIAASFLEGFQRPMGSFIFMQKSVSRTFCSLQIIVQCSLPPAVTSDLDCLSWHHFSKEGKSAHVSWSSEKLFPLPGIGDWVCICVQEIFTWESWKPHSYQLCNLKLMLEPVDLVKHLTVTHLKPHSTNKKAWQPQ